MKGVLVLSVFLASLAAVVCRPQISYKDATIIDQNNNFNGIDPWKWNFQTSNGISRNEEGSLVDEAPDVRGSYSWTAPDGSVYTVTYQSGKNGYTAQTSKGGVGIPPPALGLGVNTQISLIG